MDSAADGAAVLPAARLFQRLTTASRRWSWYVALLVGAWVAWSTQPLSVPGLLTRTQALQFSYADVYSELHELPFAYCDSYYTQREETLNGIRARAQQLGESGPLAALTVARQYDGAMRGQYEQDCRVAWRPYQNPANFQKVFTQDYPLYYLVAVLNRTEVWLALMQFVAGWLGVVAIALLSVYFWRSSLAPLVGLTVTSLLVKSAFRGAMVVAFPPIVSLGTVDQRFLFPAVTVGLIVAMLQPAVRSTGRRFPWWTAAGLALIYGLHSMLYYVVDPPVARTFSMLGAVYVGLVGLACRRWQVVAMAVMAAAAQFALDALFRGPGLEIYASVTRTNHLASDAYTNIMIYMGLFERPTPFGLFYMDEIFGWVLAQDPVLVRLAPVMAVHHSYALFGKELLWHAITSEPLTVVDAVFRRILIQIFYRPLWFFWTLKIDWVYTSTLLGILALNVCAWLRKPLFLVVTPITLCLLVNQSAVNTLMTLVHTHARWNVLGVMLMFAVAPLYFFAAVDLALATARRWRERARSPAAGWRAWALRMVSAVLLLAACGWFGRHVVTTLRQELEFVHVWMTVHVPPPEGSDMTAIIRDLESSRDRARQQSGQTAMWTASILRMYLGRHPELPRDLARQLDQVRQTSYRRALALAPQNPHFPFVAQFLEIDDWESYLLSGLQRFPDSAYAPGAVAALHYYGRRLPEPTQEWISRRYETLTDRFLSSAPSRVPGFEDVPAVARILAGTVTPAQTAPPDARGVVLTMAPGAVVLMSEKPTYGSSFARLFSSVDLRNGDVEAALAFGGPHAEQRIAASRFVTRQSQILGGRYQVFESGALPEETTYGMWLKAGAQGATVTVRQYYPVVDYPQHSYRSGLMERVRRRGAVPSGPPA